MSASRRYRVGLFSLIFVLAASAFALGIGVKGIIDDDSSAVPADARTVRVADAPAEARVQAPVEPSTFTNTTDSRFNLLDEIYEILDREFVEPDRVDLTILRTAAINGVVNALQDPHSVYIDEETFRLSSEDISGTFEGIGATVNQQGDDIIIATTFRGSPAEMAGVRSGDVILAVNGDSTEGWSLQVAVARIRGERGTPVDITVRHRNDVEETLTVIRDRIVVPSVISIQILDRDGAAVTDIGYLIITQFTERTQSELAPLLDAINAAGLTQLIIDLRGNPGGLLTATVNTVGEFIDGGLVLTQVSREGDRQDFNAPRGGNALDIDVVLLVDGGSASGSEVMAAALRDHGRAVVIGEQTIGKGTVNIPRTLSDGSVFYVSVARWLTPNGNLIEGIGVIPDIIVEPTDDDFEQRRDVQLFAAIEFFRDQNPSPVGVGS